MPGRTSEEKDEVKQDRNPPSRTQMTALWAAVLTALGSQGIPKIVELLENKPSIEQVQAMIAGQTAALTQAQNSMIDVVKDLDDKASECRLIAEKLDERTQMLKEALRDCCAKSSVRKMLDRPEPGHVRVRVQPTFPAPSSPAETSKLAKPEEHVMDLYLRSSGSGDTGSAASKLQKVPDFQVQQQMQIQEPIEFEKRNQ